MSDLKEKILLSLLAGVAFGCTISSRKQNKILKEFGKIWGVSNNKQISKELKNLKKDKLIKKIVKKGESTYDLELTEKGKLMAMECKLLSELKIKNKKWDGRWRTIIFDIPEKLRRGRDALRWKIKKLGFHELQKSVFVVPYECEGEINFVVKFFGLKQYVHYGILELTDEDMNEKLLKAFKL